MSDSSNPVKTILAPSHAATNEHGIPKGKHVAGHKIVVEGFYFAFDAKGEKVKRKYSEEFTLRAREHKLHGQGALGHILSDKLLLERLSKKDPEFRAIQTHVVTHHENVLVDAPAAPKDALAAPKDALAAPKDAPAAPKDARADDEKSEKSESDFEPAK